MSTDDNLRMAGDSNEQQAHEGTKDDRTYYRGPVMMRGDRLKLQRMISNLIDNALKFTPPQGKVTIRLERLETGIRLEVCDTGCGIPPQDLGHIFERFFRSDASRTRPGNGLGLALVHAIVTAHHGTIQVESTPGEGTVFTVDFPGEKKG